MKGARRFLFMVAMASLPSCRCGRQTDPTPAPVETRGAPVSVDAAAPAGLTVETTGSVTLVRIDPARFSFRLLDAKREGKNRQAPQWAADFGLVAVINASMYEPSGQSVGLMVDGDHVNQARDVAKMGGYFAFGPTRAGLAEVATFGRDCEGFDLGRVRADYRVVFQNYRLLDCQGRAIAWKESRVFSAAAIGMARDGRIVLAHTRAPHMMTDFAQLLAAPELGLAQMFYVEGGPEASLYVGAPGVSVRAIGNYETTFFRKEENDAFWELPNVVGVAPK